jgi:hypothetical protein
LGLFLTAETIALIQETDGKENQLWEAERIRGELMKLGVEVSKLTCAGYFLYPP